MKSACPALNILANEGKIKREDISNDELINAIYETYGIQKEIGKSLLETTKKACNIPLESNFNLEQLSIHSGSEHDVSLFHDDSPNNLRLNVEYVEQLIKLSSDGVNITWNELKQYKRSRDEAYIGTDYSISDEITAFGEMYLLMNVLGRNGNISIEHLRTMIIEEKLPKDYVISPGISIFNFLYYFLKIENFF